MWKQSTPLHPTFQPLNACLPEDWFLLPFELKLQRAHACALHAAGILSDSEHAGLGDALDEIEGEFVGAPCPESDAEDIHTWIEGKLTTIAGEAGKKIHTARSRNDQIATLLKLYVIDTGRRLAAGLQEVIVVCCEKAHAWADLAFPLQTHQQFAAPGSAGFWSLRYAASFDRVLRHLRLMLVEWSRHCPLGSGAVAGSSIPIDRRIQARELGFEEPSLNALDSTCTRDECLEILALASQAALHLQSFATDVIVFSQAALGWTKYPAAFATGSSMMPNKVNPDAMELLRGQCNTVIAAHYELVSILKGLPSGYNRDLQCVKPVLHRGVETLHSLLQMAAAFIRQLDFDPERLAASLQSGNINATLRMEENVQGGTPLREAHHAVAAEIAQSSDPAAPAIDSPLHRYQTIGGPNPDEVRRIARVIMDSVTT
ncbi:MAG: argininosuccinate lyase [Phycisphaerales bacterium]|nr:MAG: argininosuccinate lyase [Phycisphaerales bacterium]